MKGDVVNLVAGKTPDDYHCSCEYCARVIGTLEPPGGGHYSRLERREYYDPVERGKDNPNSHVAKTPLHVARWLVQAYTDPGDWVLDPTIGAGTTAVEAITQGRNVAGMEIQYVEALSSNVARARATYAPTAVERRSWVDTIQVQKTEKNGHRVVPVTLDGVPVIVDKKVTRYEPVAEYRAKVDAALAGIAVPDARVRVGDARRIGAFLDELGVEFSLVVSNPPYSGDEHAGAGGVTASGGATWTTSYRGGLPNLAFLNEGPEYWEAMAAVYADCIAHLRSGGIFATGIKDMMRKNKPFFLHRDFCDLLIKLGLKPVGTAFLKHYPTTLFLNTYHKRYGVHPPYYQTINVFEKP